MWKLMSSQIFLPGFQSMSAQAARGAEWVACWGNSTWRLGCSPARPDWLCTLRQDEEGWWGRPYPFTTPTRNSVWMASGVIICWQILPTSPRHYTLASLKLALSPTHCWVWAAFLHFKALKEPHEVGEKRKGAVRQDTLVYYSYRPSNSKKLLHLE